MKRNLLRTVLLVVLLLLAVVLGLVIGNVCEGVRGLSWLALSASFSFGPALLDLYVFKLTFGLSLSINVVQGILLIIAIFVYCKIHIKN